MVIGKEKSTVENNNSTAQSAALIDRPHNHSRPSEHTRIVYKSVVDFTVMTPTMQNNSRWALDVNSEMYPAWGLY